MKPHKLSVLLWATSVALVLVGGVCVSSVADSSASDADEEWRPKRHADAAFREVDDQDGGLVVLPGKSEVKVLNAVGILIFSLIDGTRTPEEVARAVVGEFEVDYKTALTDVYRFLDELEGEGMLAQPIPLKVRQKAGLGPRPK